VSKDTLECIHTFAVCIEILVKATVMRDIDIHVSNIEDKRLYNTLYYILALCVVNARSGSCSVVRKEEIKYALRIGFTRATATNRSEIKSD